MVADPAPAPRRAAASRVRAPSLATSAPRRRPVGLDVQRPGRRGARSSTTAPTPSAASTSAATSVPATGGAARRARGRARSAGPWCPRRRRPRSTGAAGPITPAAAASSAGTRSASGDRHPHPLEVLADHRGALRARGGRPGRRRSTSASSRSVTPRMPSIRRGTDARREPGGELVPVVDDERPHLGGGVAVGEGPAQQEEARPGCGPRR